MRDKGIGKLENNENWTVGWEEGEKPLLGSGVSFWNQGAYCVFMIVHLFHFCLKNWQHVCI